MSNELDDYVRRPVRYKNIDGIWEMGVGFLWVGMALFDRVWAIAPGSSAWYRKSMHAMCLVVLALVIYYGVGVLKKRITYPRTGYVKYQPAGARPWIAGVIAAALALATYALVLRRFTGLLPLTVGCAGFGALYAFGTRLDAAWRWVVLVLMVGGPVAISTLSLGREWADTLSLGFFGLTWLASGAITLCLYLRRTRPFELEAK